MAAALQFLDLLADRARFLFRVPRTRDGDFLARLVFGAQRLAEAPLVIRDQVRGGAEDMAGRAVVALEPDHLRAGKVLLEAQDVVDLRTAPDRPCTVRCRARLRRSRPRRAGPCQG